MIQQHKAVRPFWMLRCRVMAAMAGVLAVLWAAGGAWASSEVVDVSAVPQRTQVGAGDEVVVAVVFDHEPGWHIHTNEPHLPEELAAVMPSGVVATELRIPAVEGPGEVHWGFIQWPQPKIFEAAWGGEPVDYEVFGERAVAYLPVTVDADASPGDRIRFEVLATYQACDDMACRFAAEDEAHAVELEVVSEADAAAAAEAGPADAELFADFDAGTWEPIRAGELPEVTIPFDVFGWVEFDLRIAGWWGVAALLVVVGIGGLLLNMTPCVLPLIPLKIMGLSQMAGSRGRCFLMGLMLAGGILAFWLTIGFLVAFVSGFTDINQFYQYPVFPLAVGLFIGVMAVGMCGLFSVHLPRFVYKFEPRHDTAHGSFGFGVMAAVLSTPCTAPLMGAGAAGVMPLGATIAVMTFAAIGVGMALPYVVLAGYPQLAAKMPRTGPASLLIKQVMGLLMLGAAAFFAGTGLSGLLASPPEPPMQAYWWAVGLCVVAAGVWLGWRTWRLSPAWGKRVVFGGLGLVLVLAGGGVGARMSDPGPIAWEYYTSERLERALDEGNAVLLEFTAEWCLNCKALEQAVLFDRRVVEAVHGEGVVPMKVDLTGHYPAGRERLHLYERRSIPYMTVLSPDGEQVFEGDWFTVGQVLEALETARGGSLAGTEAEAEGL